nr:cell division protein [uncultured Kingella sp.]
MKWIFATLVALNLIVFAGFVGNKIMNPKKQQPQVVQMPQQQPQAPQQIIINTGNGTPTTVSTNGTVTTNGVPAGSAIGKIVGKTANTVRPHRNVNPGNTGAAPTAGGRTAAQSAVAEPRAKYRACSARVSIPEDDYHRIKGLLGKFPHAASRQVVQGGGEGDSQTSARMNIMFMSVSNDEAGELQSIVGRYGALNRTACDH